MSQTNAQQHHRHRHHRKRRLVWPWIVGVLAVIVLLLAAVGVMGFQLYKQAKQVQDHENNAIAMLSKLSSGDAETLANAGMHFRKSPRKPSGPKTLPMEDCGIRRRGCRSLVLIFRLFRG